jgi:imidazolonepropionase
MIDSMQSVLKSNSYSIENIGQLVTCEPLVRERRFTRISQDDLGRISDAIVVVRDGKITYAGARSGYKHDGLKNEMKIDASGHLVTTGLVDCHTHALFAGVRADELSMRLEGRTYQQIAQAGGGIRKSVAKTAQEGDQELLQSLTARMNHFRESGVTTVEVKSGYAHTVSEELRHLRLIKEASKISPLTIIPTCLALHSIPSSIKARDWVKECCELLLQEVSKHGLAKYVDAFVEEGYFSAEDARLFFDAAKKLGLGVRVHADEFSDSHGASLAAESNAASADHLQFASYEGLQRMARAQTTAVLLPGTSLFTKIPFTDAKPIKAAGCAIAVASDFNPGSCPIPNLSLMATMAAIHCGLTLPEAFAAVTWVAGHSLGLSDRKGAVVAGFDADLVVWPFSNLEEWLADSGQTKPTHVMTSNS